MFCFRFDSEGDDTDEREEESAIERRREQSKKKCNFLEEEMGTMEAPVAQCFFSFPLLSLTKKRSKYAMIHTI